MAQKQPDVVVRNEGSIYTFTPLTAKARKWVQANVQSESWQWIGGSLAVEHRMAAALAAEMSRSRLTVR